MKILNGHAYPPAISKLLGEAIALTVLLGSSLKFDGRFILQTKSDGPVRMLVVDYRSPGRIRACAQFNAADVAAAPHDRGTDQAGRLLGHGHLAMTIDQGPEMSRYQGLVALTGGISRTPPMNIFCAPQNSDPGAPCCRRSCRRLPAVPATAGAPADAAAVPAQEDRADARARLIRDVPEGVTPHVYAGG